MINLFLRTGFTFKKIFFHIDDVVKIGEDNGGIVGVADEGNSFSFFYLDKACKENKNVKPIFGVRVTCVPDAKEKVKPRGQFGKEIVVLAKNAQGVKEIYKLITIFYDNFYYRGNVSFHHINDLSKNVFVCAEDFQDEIAERIDCVILSPNTPVRIIKKYEEEKNFVASSDAYYPYPADKKVYGVFTHPKDTNFKTHPQHVMTDKEYIRALSYKASAELIEEAIANTYKIGEACNPTLEKAPNIRYDGDEKIEFLCSVGAKRRGIDIVNDGVYKERYEREIDLIKSKDFVDYFLVVSEIVRWARKRMFVGPSRGSSAGSLVCYLLGITEVDPIPYDLIFERFIDATRKDLPDIDIDFPNRDKVIKFMEERYGEDQVKSISNVVLMKPKIAINEWAKSLKIPEHETDELKNSIIDRSLGDARAKFRLIDTFDTNVGKEFLEEFPKMKSVARIESHPRHFSTHAAGIVVCNKPLYNYCGVNAREKSIMMEKIGAEALNLLKIDILGLTTLAILEDCCKKVGMDYKELYTIGLEDEKTFKVFNDDKMSCIFQFEGYSLRQLTRRMGVHRFEDIVAITSLARPGALYSGGASRYIKYRLGEEDPIYISDVHKEITETTFSCVVYQEQILRICREIGGMSWTDVHALRRALSKSYGKEYFNKYKDKFVEGASKQGYSQKDCDFLWAEVENGGAYAFNKSHAVAYAMISYWTAYMKAYYPKQFVVSNLNHIGKEDSCIKLLREAVAEGFEYNPVDADESINEWAVNSSGVIVGPLSNIKGIGLQNARKIVAARKDPSVKVGKSIMMKMLEPETPYDILYPTAHFWGDIFKRPRVYGLTRKLSEIQDVNGEGSYIIIGKLREKNVKDLNEYVNLMKRGGKVLKKDTLMLSIKVEDDTDTIMCNVNRFEFEQIGRPIAEHGEVDQSWYIIEGEIKFGRYLNIIQIQELTEDLLEK